jgi:oxygen-independent coproporphyrinogen-3 oxidase
VSFDDQFLSVLGRVHDRAQAIAAVEEAASVRDLQPDIMYALPGQTLEQAAQDYVWRWRCSPRTFRFTT